MHPDIFNESPQGAAWPHKPHMPNGPVLFYFRWKSEVDEQFWLKIMTDTLDTLRRFAISEGLATANTPYYSNLCLESMSVSDIYRENLGNLRRVKAIYDPSDVMGLTGGFKIRPV